jgi:SET domain-containing protein
MTFIETPVAARDLPIEPIRISRVMGIGAFARKDIPRYKIVCEYFGEVIDEEEANRRDELYQGDSSKPPAMFSIGKKKYLDPYQDGRGGTISRDDNPG